MRSCDDIWCFPKLDSRHKFIGSYCSAQSKLKEGHTQLKVSCLPFVYGT